VARMIRYAPQRQSLYHPQQDSTVLTPNAQPPLDALCAEMSRLRVDPVLLVDWSDLDAWRRNQVLRVSVVVEGRALTVYEEVHGRKTTPELRILNNNDCAWHQYFVGIPQGLSLWDPHEFTLNLSHRSSVSVGFHGGY